MLTTEVYGLNLPEAGDQYNVADMNENTTKIDTAMNDEANARALADEEINETITPITKEQIDKLKKGIYIDDRKVDIIEYDRNFEFI